MNSSEFCVCLSMNIMKNILFLRINEERRYHLIMLPSKELVALPFKLLQSHRHTQDTGTECTCNLALSVNHLDISKLRQGACCLMQKQRYEFDSVIARSRITIYTMILVVTLYNASERR